MKGGSPNNNRYKYKFCKLEGVNHPAWRKEGKLSLYFHDRYSAVMLRRDLPSRKGQSIDWATNQRGYKVGIHTTNFTQEC